jgi:hypothetical protein
MRIGMDEMRQQSVRLRTDKPSERSSSFTSIMLQEWTQPISGTSINPFKRGFKATLVPREYDFILGNQSLRRVTPPTSRPDYTYPLPSLPSSFLPLNPTCNSLIN